MFLYSSLLLLVGLGGAGLGVLDGLGAGHLHLLGVLAPPDGDGDQLVGVGDGLGVAAALDVAGELGAVGLLGLRDAVVALGAEGALDLLGGGGVLHGVALLGGGGDLLAVEALLDLLDGGVGALAVGALDGLHLGLLGGPGVLDRLVEVELGLVGGVATGRVLVEGDGTGLVRREVLAAEEVDPAVDTLESAARGGAVLAGNALGGEC